MVHNFPRAFQDVTKSQGVKGASSMASFEPTTLCGPTLLSIPNLSKCVQL